MTASSATLSNRAKTLSKNPTAKRPKRRREDTSHEALLAALNDERRTLELKGKVCANARSRFGIQLHDAEDIFHEAVLTYLGIHSRYGQRDNHFGLLVGIFHKKCLEFLGRVERRGRVNRRMAANLQANQPFVARGEDPKGPAVERVIRREDAALIRDAIHSLEDESQEILLDLAEGRVSRLEMIDRMGINRNTFDSRLRSLRLRLKRELAENGVL